MNKEEFQFNFFPKALPICLVDIKPSGAESKWQKQVRSKAFNLDIDISFRVTGDLDGAVMKALAFQQYGLGSSSGFDQSEMLSDVSL